MGDRPPAAVVGVAVLAVAFVTLPLLATVVRAPWSRLGEVWSSPVVADALRLSLVCSLAAAALCLVLGLPLSWVLARVAFPGRRLVRSLALLSLVLPPVVGGVALLMAFGRRGLVGRWLDQAFGVQLPFSTAGVILAEAFVALPFLVLTLESAFRSVDRRLEEAAATLGAGRWATLVHVTLPGLAPALLAGLVLAWARALGEFGATITFAGNLQGRTQTMPLATYLTLETDPDAALLLSLLLVGISLAVILGLRDRWWSTPEAR